MTNSTTKFLGHSVKDAAEQYDRSKLNPPYRVEDFIAGVMWASSIIATEYPLIRTIMIEEDGTYRPVHLATTEPQRLPLKEDALDVRDRFAMHILPTVMWTFREPATHVPAIGEIEEKVAAACYAQADAMMKERAK